jgi:hypothetical protein
MGGVPVSPDPPAVRHLGPGFGAQIAFEAVRACLWAQQLDQRQREPAKLLGLVGAQSRQLCRLAEQYVDHRDGPVDRRRPDQVEALGRRQALQLGEAALSSQSGKRVVPLRPEQKEQTADRLARARRPVPMGFQIAQDVEGEPPTPRAPGHVER